MNSIHTLNSNECDKLSVLYPALLTIINRSGKDVYSKTFVYSMALE